MASSKMSSWSIWAINDDDVRGPFFSVVKLRRSVIVLVYLWKVKYPKKEWEDMSCNSTLFSTNDGRSNGVGVGNRWQQRLSFVEILM